MIIMALVYCCYCTTLQAQDDGMQHSFDIGAAYSANNIDFNGFASSSLYGVGVLYSAQATGWLYFGLESQYTNSLEGQQNIDFGLQAGLTLFSGETLQFPVGGSLGIYHFYDSDGNHSGGYYSYDVGMKVIFTDRFGFNAKVHFQTNAVSDINDDNVESLDLRYKTLLLTAGFTFIL